MNEVMCQTGSPTFKMSSCVIFNVALPLIHSCMKLINRAETRVI